MGVVELRGCTIVALAERATHQVPVRTSASGDSHYAASVSAGSFFLSLSLIAIRAPFSCPITADRLVCASGPPYLKYVNKRHTAFTYFPRDFICVTPFPLYPYDYCFVSSLLACGAHCTRCTSLAVACLLVHG